MKSVSIRCLPKAPHVLWVPSWYPDAHRPVRGIFFLEQAAGLNARGLNIGVVYPSIFHMKQMNWSRLATHRFQTRAFCYQGINTVMHCGWYPFVKMKKWKIDWWVFQAIACTKKYIEKYGKPDLIHAQSALWGGVAARVISEKFHIPYIVTEHNSDFFDPMRLPKDDFDLSRSVFQNAACRLAVSRSLKESLEKAFDIPVQVMPNPVDTDFFTLSPRLKKPFSFFFLGGLDHLKNVHLLLEAFALVAQKIPEACLEIGGEGPLRQELIELIERRGLKERVQFLGRLSRGEVLKAYHRADAFVLSSRQETFGVVLIEALATGIPVIATNCGGPRDIINSKTGLIADHTPESLSEAMLYVLENRDHYRPEALRKYAEDVFGYTRFVNHYHEMVIRDKKTGS